jgi:hypothetical protein
VQFLFSVEKVDIGNGMPDPKTPKFRLIKGGHTPVQLEARPVSLTSFMKFAQEISMMEHGPLNQDAPTPKVTDLSSLMPESPDSPKKHSAPKKLDRS